MEAENYLSGGYGTRLALEAQRIRPAPLSQLATAWQPSRLKGIQLDKEFGTPFLAATQVFDLRPAPRKFLSLDRTENSSERFIENGTIVVTCSGSVGRSTLIYGAHDGVLISHDLLRLTPKEHKYWGWLYAYLRSASVRQMMTSAQYGHMIKHLEPSHMHALPVPVLRDDLLDGFQTDATCILDLRNEAWRLQKEAEGLFASFIGKVEPRIQNAETGFVVRAEDLFSNRRRLEAGYHSPVATGIISHFEAKKLRIDPLKDVTSGVWWLSRFKRIFGEEGDRYFSADELFSLNPGVAKRVMVEQADDPDAYRVKAGWIIMACSGQTYGLNGSVSLMTEQHEDAFFSHDLVRIIPKASEIRSGYLFTALGHPDLGRPLVIRNAYGTSIPHLDPDDVAQIPVVRLGNDREEQIADIMERAINLRVQADTLENGISDRAERLIEKFLAGETESFSVAPLQSR